MVHDLSIIDRKPSTAAEETAQQPLLFQVWIDLNFGGEFGPPNWWWNSEPQPLQAALQEAAEARELDWVCCVMPEGTNPRPDGRWDNPP